MQSFVIATPDIIDMPASSYMTHHFGAIAQMLHHSARDRADPCLSIHHSPPIVPTSVQSVRSYEAISYLRQKTLETGLEGVDFCLNPLAPLFADFHIRIPSTNSEDPYLLRIEHKLGQNGHGTEHCGVAFASVALFHA